MLFSLPIRAVTSQLTTSTEETKLQNRKASVFLNCCYDGKLTLSSNTKGFKHERLSEYSYNELVMYLAQKISTRNVISLLTTNYFVSDYSEKLAKGYRIVVCKLSIDKALRCCIPYIMFLRHKATCSARCGRNFPTFGGVTC